jgi:C-terminal processing protease CtpA/Prc
LHWNRILGALSLALALVVASGASYAGGKECHAGEKAENAADKSGHECGMKAEECAQMMKKDAKTHGWLGIGLDMGDTDQLTVDKVWAGSPAEKAGFQVGDRVVSINGVEANGDNLEKIHGMQHDAKIGEKTTWVVARGTEQVTLEATLAKISDEALAESIDHHMKGEHKIVKN